MNSEDDKIEENTEEEYEDSDDENYICPNCGEEAEYDYNSCEVCAKIFCEKCVNEKGFENTRLLYVPNCPCCISQGIEVNQLIEDVKKMRNKELRERLIKFLYRL